MKISQNLILKGAAGGAAATAATTAAIYGENIYSFFATGSFQIVDETEKIASLNIPLGEKCKWPDRYSIGPTLCEFDTDKLKEINFHEKNTSGLTVTGSGNFILTIERLWGNEIFDKGYRFVLKAKNENNDVTVTISSNLSVHLGKDRDFEFKIKEEGKNWYLERAWDEKTIREKIGLDCQSNNNVCSLGGGRKINVMVGAKKVEGISNLSEGTIKLYKNTKDYQQGLKFTIENKDIPLNGGTTIKKFERDETYEIKRDRNKWYLSRKTSAIDAINENLKGLGLPDTCKMNESGNAEGCELDKGKLESINFDGKARGETLTAEGADGVTLKLERTNKGDDKYPHEVKIIFENTKEVTIKKNGNSDFINWKKGTNTEYKIKGSGDSKTLEKAWTLVNLAYEVGMTSCNNSGSVECSLATSSSVKDGNKIAFKKNLTESGKKIKREENQAEYNQGFKFTPLDDISFISNSAVKKLKKEATYEIRELNWEGKKEWFLVKKTLSPEEVKIKEAVNKKIGDVGISKTECKFQGDEENLICELSDTDLKSVKFDGKGSQDGLTITPPGNTFNLKISRAPDSENLNFTFVKPPAEVKIESPQTVILEKGVDAKFVISESGGSSTLKKIAK